jgi:phage baseplate assembly protein V
MLKYGVISDINPSAGLARVHFDDDDIVSDWLPILVPKAMEDSFSFFPDINEQVACLMDENAENGVILGSMYNSQTQPNGGSKDKWRVRFNDGTVIEYDRAVHKLTADVQGEVEVKATTTVKVQAETIEATASGTAKVQAPTITAQGNVTVTGTLTVQGAVTAASTITAGATVTAPLVAAGGLTGPGGGALPGGLNIQGNVEASGSVEADGDVKAGTISLTNHVHGGVMPGSGSTTPPTP